MQIAIYLGVSKRLGVSILSSKRHSVPIAVHVAALAFSNPILTLK